MGSRLWRTGAVAALVVAAAAPQANAQNLFELLFGGLRSRPAPTAYAPADRFSDGRFQGYGDTVSPGSAGRSVAFCVRTCDGRYFPVARGAGQATPVQLCNALCPASATKVVSGSSIETAFTVDGRAYSDLPNAFVYRDKVVSGCTCNGRDPFGLARIDIDDDPTLQRGDIVAAKGELLAYTGQRGRHATAEFRPVSRGALPRDLRTRLEKTPVAED